MFGSHRVAPALQEEETGEDCRRGKEGGRDRELRDQGVEMERHCVNPNSKLERDEDEIWREEVGEKRTRG
jgi:hypothetical protein